MANRLDLTAVQLETVRVAAKSTIDRLREVSGQVQFAVGTFSASPAYDSVYRDVVTLFKAAQEAAKLESPSLPDTTLPALKMAVICHRRDLAERYDDARVRVADPDVLRDLRPSIDALDELMGDAWFQATEGLHLPKLSDFLTLERALADAPVSSAARVFDEKFHILQSPSQVKADIAEARKLAEMRSASIAFAFLDVDDFKAFNTDHGETTVDVNVLPELMRTIERAAYGRGFAYRYGGDEYGILLLNATNDQALSIIDRVRVDIEALRYRDVKRTATVSVGLVVVPPESHLTNHEVVVTAEHAKAFAKNSGKNRVAGYTSDLYDEDSLVVLAPEGS